MVVTKNPHSWFVVTDSKSKKTLTLFNDETPGHNYPFGFEVNFSDSPTPAVNTVTIYNLSQSHKSFFKKGDKCVLYFNWGSSRKVISQGFISKIDMTQHDGTTDTQVITFTEGTNYNNIQARKLKVRKKTKQHNTKTIKVTKVYKSGKKKGKKHTVNKRVRTRGFKTKLANRVFKKGTTYKKIIQGIASQTGIKIAKLDLAHNKKMKKAYTASGKPLDLIKGLVKQCGSVMTYVRGKLEIINPKSNKRTWYVIDDQDLIQPPSYNESDDDDDDSSADTTTTSKSKKGKGKKKAKVKKVVKNQGTWEITIPLVPEITTNVGIQMKSKYLKGRFYVKSGKHSSDGENPQTQASLAAL